MPVQPGALAMSRNADAQRLWSVRAATSSPAARMEAKASRGSPAPSDSQVWLCRSAWASHDPGNSRDPRLVPQASGCSRRWDGGCMLGRYREPAVEPTICTAAGLAGVGPVQVPVPAHRGQPDRAVPAGGEGEAADHALAALVVAVQQLHAEPA